MTSKNSKHKAAMQKQKAAVDASVEAASEERGIAVLLTGDGKGKTSSAFGMVMRARGYNQRIAVIQFIKGEMLSGEEIYIRDKCPDVIFIQMGTGFTWDTQDRTSDMRAAEKTWAATRPLLADPEIDLIILDELTYMLAYDYLPENEVIDAINNRPREQSVVVTGRGGGKCLHEAMDTISEVKEVRHAFRDGVKARKGVDY